MAIRMKDTFTTLGFLGPRGTYTEEAATQFAPGCRSIPFATIDEVFKAVQNGTVERGLVPIENVIAGPVTETLDNLYTYAQDVKILDMMVLSIEHALGVWDAAAPVTDVYSKDQALKQCSSYLSGQWPAAALHETASTALAMQQVATAKKSGMAAIGSPASLSHYGLSIVARNIGNISNNKTRFVVLGPRQTLAHIPTGADATALVVYPHRDRIGLLQQILYVVSHTHGLSCSAIHSRPDTRGAFRFYLEIEGHEQQGAMAACVAELKQALGDEEVDIIVFGTYPRRPFNPKRIGTIGIIGGTGQMGAWFSRFFGEAGYKVLIAGRNTALSYEQCVKQSDVVLCNVPIRNTDEILRAIAPHCRPGQLLVDNTSIKTQPVQTMLDVAPPGVEVLGMHTVFGPAIAQLRGQNVIFTRTARSDELAGEFEGLFYKYGAKVTYTTPQHHDQQMAFHQNLEHFTKIVLAEMVHRHFQEPGEMGSYSSPNSRASLATMGRILKGDPALYAEIQTYNQQGPEMIDSYVRICERLRDALLQNHAEAFSDSLKTSRSELGAEFVEQLWKDSLKNSGRG